MANILGHINPSLLPEEANRELMDFYDFLIVRYGKKRPAKRIRFKKLITIPLKVRKINLPDRDLLHER